MISMKTGDDQHEYGCEQSRGEGKEDAFGSQDHHMQAESAPNASSILAR